MTSKKQFDDAAPPSGGSDPSDLDPFAELTRIMGFDPRQPVESKAKPEAPSEEGLIAALNELDGQPGAPMPAVAKGLMAKPVHVSSKPDDGMVDDFGIDLERELLGDLLADAEPAAAQAQDDEFDAVFAEEVNALEASFNQAPRAEQLAADVEELNAAFAEAEIETAAPVAEDIGSAITAELAAAPVAEPVSLPHEISFDDLDFGDIEAAIGREMDQALRAAATGNAVAEDAADSEFESALQDDFEDDFREPEVIAGPTVKPQANLAAASDGLANVDMDFDSGLDWSALDAKDAAPHKAAVDAAAAPAKSAFELEADDLLAALNAAAAKTAEVSPGLAGKAPAASNPEQVSALAKMADRYHNQDNHDAWQPLRAPQSRVAAPEVETTEMFDKAFSVVDDLDLPEIAYDEPVAAASEIDLEFDNLLNEMSRGEVPRSRPVAASAYEAPSFEPRTPVAPRVEQAAEDYEFDSVFAQPEVSEHPMSQDLGQFDFDDEDLEQEDLRPQAPYRGNSRGNGGRGMMIAAIVGGIAVLGGLGAAAMSWRDGATGAPAMVRADAGPVKVRPENPGGTTVPNRDSTVYEAVSRSGGSQTATQERLVSATEDPIALPQPNDEEVDEIAAAAKGEDRIEPGQADDAAQDPVAVAPRKVRTVIVKPDGSLAPAPEEPAEAANSAAIPASVDTTDEVAAIADEAPEQITTGATKPTPAKPEPVAATPVAAGGWAVQIASQPSEDGANKSLKSMSQKYSGVIGDRSLQIVKAEVPNKGTYWRVRVAAASRDDAVSVCSSLKSAGGTCFVTR